jgi:molybdopterin synthase catalytic subunit
MDRRKNEAVFWKREEAPEGSRWIEPTDADRSAVARWEAATWE